MYPFKATAIPLGVIFALGISACNPTPDNQGTVSNCTNVISETAEKDYWEARSYYFEVFKTPGNYAKEFNKTLKSGGYPQDYTEAGKLARTRLRDLLLPLVGCVDVKDLPSQASITIDPIPDMNSDVLDGLRYYSSKDKFLLIITTEGLLKRYISSVNANEGHVKWPNDINLLARIEEFYSMAIDRGGFVIRYAEIPVKTERKNTSAYAYLGMSTQGDGTPKPNEIVVAAKKDNQILILFSKWPITADTAIKNCFSEQKQTTDFIVNQGDSYIRCYEKEASKQPFFTGIQKYAQEMVDNLLIARTKQK